jgi:hypothetical protein
MSSPALPHVPADDWFAHSETVVVWAAFEALPEPLKHQLLVRIQDHLAAPDERATPYDTRVAKSIAAVREAAAVHQAATGQESLSSYAYDQLQRERDDWPPIATVRRHLGVRTWPEVLLRCYLPAAPEGDEVAATTSSVSNA